MQTRPTIICLTPVKNEAWILHRFLKCASLWADHIIIADQGSDDGSREIAQCYPKVILIDNPSVAFNEPERQKLLLAEARKIPGPRLLIALDADEMLTANFADSLEWQTILNSSKGTVFNFRLVNLLPYLRSCWIPPYRYYFGFMDDGSDHLGRTIHSPRIPIPHDTSIIMLQDIMVLHYQFTDWERMESKHRWYQCWERLNCSSQSAIQIYRQYHHMDAVPSNSIQPILAEWLRGYERQGIDMTSIQKATTYWWDRAVLTLLSQHTPKRFKKEAIWGVNWDELNNQFNKSKRDADYRDPRNIFDKLVHRWLRKTQRIHSKRWVRLIDRILSWFGW